MKRYFLFLLIAVFIISFVSAEGLTKICIDKTLPSAPSNLVVSGSVGSILLIWDASTDEPDCSGIDYYNVSRNNVFLKKTTSLNFTDSDNLVEGNYTYTVYAVDMVGHNRGDFIVNEIVLAKDGTTGTITVGGGGGGSSYVVPDSFKVYTVAGWELDEGFEKGLEKNDKMNFEISDEPYNLTILNVDYNKVEIVFESMSQLAIFGPNESKSFDLNNNSLDDLLVSVGNIINGFAEIKIQSINEDIESQINLDDGITPNVEEVNGNLFSVITGAVSGAMGTVGRVGIIVFIFLALGVFVVIRIRKKKG